ncbi:MAG: DNA-3-methyladenine glycosylase [Merismopedia sp. SIO2A8]|nr:DNA-3-methyladenine glycosylase [Merismopedia sp. SIO2A8]
MSHESAPCPVIVSAEWLDRPVTEVAPDLVGCTLVRQFPDGTQVRGVIVETEAYGPGDPACHAYRRQTPRNRVMFGPAGFAYVYLIYGMYHCFNVVTEGTNVASAVLIRALALDALPSWVPDKKRKQPHRAAAGPGKLCQVLQIDRNLSDRPLIPTEALWLEHRSLDLQAQITEQSIELVQTTRIGLSQGQDIPWRWYWRGHPAVSKK